MRWVRPLGYVLLLYGALLGSHLLAFQLGVQQERGRLAQLYIRLNEAARTDGAIVSLMDDWERDLKACHQRLTLAGMRLRDAQLAGGAATEEIREVHAQLRRLAADPSAPPALRAQLRILAERLARGRSGRPAAALSGRELDVLTQVALHGCTQQAADFDQVGFDALADQYKFYVVYAEQPAANNPVSCFNWFGKYNQPSDKTNLQRGKGENESIAEMVVKTKADFAVDPSRVFIAGFSAGGSMTSVMLADWPEIFSAGRQNEGRSASAFGSIMSEEALYCHNEIGWRRLTLRVLRQRHPDRRGRRREGLRGSETRCQSLEGDGPDGARRRSDEIRKQRPAGRGRFR